MSAKAKRVTLRLLNDLIAANSTDRIRGRLRGALGIRAKAIKRANDLKAILRMAGTGTEWQRSSVDTTTKELRSQAADARLSAEVRITAIERLCVLGGFLSPSTLSHDPIDEFIRQIVAPAPEQKPVESTPLVNGAPPTVDFDFEDVVARVRKQQEEQRGTIRDMGTSGRG
jgi:hypothetical protein